MCICGFVYRLRPNEIHGNWLVREVSMLQVPQKSAWEEWREWGTEGLRDCGRAKNNNDDGQRTQGPSSLHLRKLQKAHMYCAVGPKGKEMFCAFRGQTFLLFGQPVFSPPSCATVVVETEKRREPRGRLSTAPIKAFCCSGSLSSLCPAACMCVCVSLHTHALPPIHPSTHTHTHSHRHRHSHRQS